MQSYTKKTNPIQRLITNTVSRFHNWLEGQLEGQPDPEANTGAVIGFMKMDRKSRMRKK